MKAYIFTVYIPNQTITAMISCKIWYDCNVEQVLPFDASSVTFLHYTQCLITAEQK